MTDTSRMPPINPISGFFLAVLAAAVVLTILVVIIPSDLFLALSNYLQILAALAGALILIYLRHRTGFQQAFLWVGAGFGLWGISNIGWYVLTVLGYRNLVFPSVIDIGLILGLLLIAFALWTGLVGETPAPAIIVTILILSLSVPALMVLAAGFSLLPAIITYCYFAACGLLIAGGLSVTKCKRPLVTAGTMLVGLSFMIYPLREIYLVNNPLLLAIGPVIGAGFALIVLGLLPVCESATAA